MKIVLRQKIVSLLASYTASDEQGKVVSLISQKFTVPASYEMLDAKGKLTYYLKGEIFNIKVEDEEGNVLYNIRPTKKDGLIS
jgi:uncharacterized protein YxjI